MPNVTVFTMLLLADTQQGAVSWSLPGPLVGIVLGLLLVALFLLSYFTVSDTLKLMFGGKTKSMKQSKPSVPPVFSFMDLMDQFQIPDQSESLDDIGVPNHVSTSMNLQPLKIQEIADILIDGGWSALYISDRTVLSSVLQTLDKNTAICYTHDEGEDLILLGDNEIDHVRIKFRNNQATTR